MALSLWPQLIIAGRDLVLRLFVYCARAQLPVSSPLGATYLRRDQFNLCAIQFVCVCVIVCQPTRRAPPSRSDLLACCCSNSLALSFALTRSALAVGCHCGQWDRSLRAAITSPIGRMSESRRGSLGSVTPAPPRTLICRSPVNDDSPPLIPPIGRLGTSEERLRDLVQWCFNRSPRDAAALSYWLTYSLCG